MLFFEDPLTPVVWPFPRVSGIVPRRPCKDGNSVRQEATVRKAMQTQLPMSKDALDVRSDPVQQWLGSIL